MNEHWDEFFTLGQHKNWGFVVECFHHWDAAKDGIERHLEKDRLSRKEGKKRRQKGFVKEQLECAKEEELVRSQEEGERVIYLLIHLDI